MCHSCLAGANLGVLAFKISILRQKLVIFCATCTRAILSVLACKISALRQKLVITCATRARANSGILACKIGVLCQKLVRVGPKIYVLALKISI